MTRVGEKRGGEREGGKEGERALGAEEALWGSGL